ncbi:PREDICTED: THAP domain-containing protein 1-like [Trachymyrmex cornetzi]|uniref:THAP domain-containing protein 1-like n=3 Tax=Attini TaxID=143999 RepID=UPI00084F65FB|nr:PREDICTED: THAP domain-containing protein 1-like [Trachymyrmex cornetzi]
MRKYSHLFHFRIFFTMTCNVNGCGNYLAKTKKIGGKIKYFSFPKDPVLSNKWHQACGKKNISKYSRICSKHFSDACFTKNLQQQLLGYSPSKTRKLRPDTIPTLHLRTVSNEGSSTAVVLDEIMTPSASNEDSSTPVEFDEIMTPSASNEGSSTAVVLDEIMTPSASNEGSSTPSTSTEAIMSSKIHDLELQVTALKKTIKKYEKARPKEDKELVERKMYELLGKIFSQGQIRMILNPSLCKMKWSSEDITHAISLRCVSPKAYRYMKHVLQIPLPGLSTLRRCSASSQVVEESFSGQRVYLEGENS